MQLIVFGATGIVGQELVKQALFNGDKVKAFGRNVFTTDFPKNDNLTLVQGALFDAGEVCKAIKGCDGVLSALGGDFSGSDLTRSLGMKNIIAQMDKLGVKRIVGVGGLGVLNLDEDNLLIDAEDYPEQYKPVGVEHVKAFRFLESSDLDWTFVCPPNIISAAPTGAFTTAANYPPEVNRYKITSGDLALFMLNELKAKAYVKQRVGISN